MSLLDPKNMEKLLAENQGERVLLACEDHQYFPGNKFSLPQQVGCKHCILAKLWFEFSKVPPEKRLERAEELLTVTHHMSEDVERGRFDMCVYSRPQVTIEKDVDGDPGVVVTDLK